MASPNALVKVPFLLASSLFVHFALTPPNPPPKPEEIEKYGGSWTLRERSIFSLPNVNIVLRVRHFMPSPNCVVADPLSACDS